MQIFNSPDRIRRNLGNGSDLKLRVQYFMKKKDKKMQNIWNILTFWKLWSSDIEKKMSKGDFEANSGWSDTSEYRIAYNDPDPNKIFESELCLSEDIYTAFNIHLLI